MGTINRAILIGRLTQDPELRFSQGSNMAVVKFTLAVDKGMSKQKKEEAERQGKPTADFPRIIAFGKTAEMISSYLSKGKMCAIEGSIQTGSYTKQDGTKVYTTEVLASRVEFLEKSEPQQQQNTNQQQNFNQDQNNNFDDFQNIPDSEIPF